MLKLLVYGAGVRGKLLVESICDLYNVIWVDKSENVWGTVHSGVCVQPFSAISEVSASTKFVITVANQKNYIEIQKMLCEELDFFENNEIPYLSAMKEGAERKFSGLTAKKAANGVRPSIIFCCPYGMGLGGIPEWTKLICEKFLIHEKKAVVLTNGDDINLPLQVEKNRLIIKYDTHSRYDITRMKELVDFIGANLPCILVTSQPDEILVSCSFLKQLFGDKLTVIAGIRGGSESIYNDYYALRDCVDYFVCVSSDISNAMINRGIPKENVHTMICPVTHPDKFERKYAVENDAPVRLGFAGRIEVEQKRMDLMKKVICLLEENGVNYVFDIAGDGPYKEELESFIKENNIFERVHFLGILSQKEISDFWSRHDICVNIADFEGRSRMVAEAMAHGAVPVVTRVSGTNDDIHEGENGFTVDIGDYEALADKIKYLDDNRHLLPVMGEKAYQELEPKCDYEKHYLWWEKLLNSIGY